MIQLLDDMQTLLKRGEIFALATVIDRSGSAPRSAGAKMLVRQDGSIEGTVGGGILEAQVRELAAKVLRDHQTLLRGFQFNGKDAASMDAICGGQVEVLVEWIDVHNPQMGAVIRGLDDAYKNHQKAWLLTLLHPGKDATTHTLALEDGSLIGSLPEGVSIGSILEARTTQQRQLDAGTLIIEPVNNAGSALIFGAGHVSRSLAEFTHAVGFRTVVIDDRPEYASRERFPLADELVVLDSFADLAKKMEFNRDSYIVIVTRGHLNDQDVVEQVLKTDAAYIGMIGSRRKCELIFQDMRRKGYSEEDIMRVHAPIGIPIQAETPEEIGVSIAAEMIRERAVLLTKPQT
jgi:xanthine dehydrogenase accessory factor